MTDVKLCFVLRSEHVAVTMNLMQPYCKVATIEGVTEVPDALLGRAGHVGDMPSPPFEQQILGTLPVSEGKPRRKAAAQPAETISEPRPPGRPRGGGATRYELALQVLRRHGEPMDKTAFHDEVMRVTRGDRRASHNTLAYLKKHKMVRVVSGKLVPK